ncbi:MAG: type II toxin-antitoxin system VapC family toxin [Chloroflexi bacterium]|nr:type II toxin-antitoxin system VapC family toxin [Chloroflexota bacterium]
MIVDTSAIVAVLRGEQGARAYSSMIESAPIARISAATYVELGIVIDGLKDPVLSGSLDAFLVTMAVVVEPFTTTQARIARSAYQRFGKGSGHPARLNMGDCFAYALARELEEPLLFKGDDFKLTDIEVVIEPTKHKRLSEVIANYGSPLP